MILSTNRLLLLLLSRLNNKLMQRKQKTNEINGKKTNIQQQLTCLKRKLLSIQVVHNRMPDSLPDIQPNSYIHN